MKHKDCSGSIFGKLTLVRRATKEELSHLSDSSKTKPYYLCDCACGEKGKIIGYHNLKSGKTLSCGCLGRKQRASRTRKALGIDDSDYVDLETNPEDYFL